MLLASGKPSPPMRYSAIVADLEREFPEMDLEDIHKMAGEKLHDVKESLERLKSGNTIHVYRLTV
jgi:hypothetical protein